MPRLLLTRLYPEPVEIRARRDYEVTGNPVDAQWTTDALLEAADGMDGILLSSPDKMSRETLLRMPESVKIIATFSVGYEHIDVDAAVERGLIVTNTPDVLTDATADITLLCLLGAARRANEGMAMIREDGWHGWAPTQMMGTEVTGKTLGIVGMGRIGQAVADRARGFGMKIHYNNRRPLPEKLAKGATFHTSPLELAGAVDFVSINCPATPETKGLVNEDFITAMRPGAILVNTARGAVVQDDPLIAALKSGHLAAAGLDVFDGEPNIDPRYRELDNLFALPHLGSATFETRCAMGFRALDNLDAVLLRKEPAPFAVTG